MVIFVTNSSLSVSSKLPSKSSRLLLFTLIGELLVAPGFCYFGHPFIAFVGGLTIGYWFTVLTGNRIGTRQTLQGASGDTRKTAPPRVKKPIRSSLVPPTASFSPALRW